MWFTRRQHNATVLPDGTPIAVSVSGDKTIRIWDLHRRTLRHTYAHWLMLRAGLARADRREVLGQLPRLAASLLFSRIWVPAGNTGRARVGAFAVMPIPEDLRDHVA